MRKFSTPLALLFLFSFYLNGIKLHGQQPTFHVKTMLNAGVKNYTTFTAPNTEAKNEAIAQNAGYEQHPEVGMLFAEAPCDNCYELIGKRTEQSKVFVKSGTNGRDVMQQTSSGAMHYKGTNGEWLTIKSQLQPLGNGMFGAMEQEAPVVINTANKFSALGKEGQQFRFNNNLELVNAQFDGPEVSLGHADYSHYTAGDDGVYITNAWPGIDIEMYVVRGAIKTNFVINHAMPDINHMGHLVIRDNVQLEKGWSLQYDGEENHYGNWEVRNAAGEKVYAISRATAYEKNDVQHTIQKLMSYTTGSALDIAVPGELLNKPASSYPLVIDPLVTLASPSSVNGSTYSSGWTTGCVYNNPATVPADVTVTDVQFTFQYVTGGGAVLNNGAYDFKLGTCRSPSVPSLYWNCNSLLTGTCDAILATIYAQVSSCIPAPQCASYNLNLAMNFYQNYASTAACSPTYIMAGTPLTITVSGHSVEAGPITTTSPTICQGKSTVLAVTSSYGVGPYSYSWTPGGATGTTDTVSPATTTTYTVTATDACGGKSTATTTVTVNTVSPISGVSTVCIGGSSTLSSSPAGGTWTSANTAIATIGSTSGIVSGVSLGTTTITYTTLTGCITTTAVTVKAAIAAITGYPMICQGSTTSLGDATPSGTWSSSNTAVAIVGSATGFATGISGGTATITYSTYGGGCYAIAPITVNPLSAISGTLTICVGGSTTLTDAVPGGTWSTGSSLVTVGTATGVVNGISIGSASVTYTTPAGCIATTTIVVNFMSPIAGTATVCQGSTTTLSDGAPGGVWASGNTAVATISSATGIVTGVSGGTSLISYSIPGGCFTSKTVTVNPISPISGTPGVCVGGTTTLSDAVGAGTWSSSNTGVAKVGSTTGVVIGVAVGTSTITYTSAAGCSATTLVSITLPTPITGTTNVCQGSTTTLSNTTPSGIWSSSNPAVAIAGSASGVITGVTGGVVNITYTTPAGCAVTTPLTVNANPPITGTTLLCAGTTTTLSSSAGSGTWNSGSTGIATVDPVSGIVSGVAPGTAGITFTTAAGCIASTTVTVNVPSPITGTPKVCEGSSTLLGNAVPSGLWSSSNTAIAVVGVSTGIVTGIAGGAATINYSTAGGCNATLTFTVNPLSLVTGPTTVCAGGNITLSDATPGGGTWSSGDITLATVGSMTGVVSGVAAGTVAINFTTVAGCVAAALVTVDPAPSAIIGSTLICTTGALSDAVTGGFWASSDPTIASIDPASGFVSGINPGTVTIKYTLSGGCFVTTTLTVDPITPITGVPSVCQGSTTTLAYPNTGGTWTSSNTAVATVDTGGVVTGMSAGTSIIKYTTSTGCLATVIVTVHPLLPITGAPTVCQGGTTTLSDGTPSGSWSSSAPGVAGVSGSTGVVSGVMAGTAVISYTTTSGCTATTTVTVNPTASITGTSAICAGSTTTLNDAVSAGSWSSVNPGIAGIDPSSGLVSGVSAGTTTIKYTTPAGCVVNLSFTVNALPPAITGGPAVCQGQTTTLSNTLTGGAWSSSDLSVATIVTGTGLLTGVAAGTATISYSTTAGCFAVTAVTVNPLLPIYGSAAICAGNNTTLYDTTQGGGTWSSTVTTIATIDPTTGLVAGVSAGTTVIKFTTVLGCITTLNETVNPLPSVIVGSPKVCVGSTATLSNALLGGTWSITNTSVATIGSISGVVTGVSPDTATVIYTSTAGCVATMIISVNPLPLAITGTASLCAGSSTILSDATPVGTWSSTGPSVASVGSTTGVVTGLSAGVVLIKYTTPQGCFANFFFTVNAMPAAITGPAAVCEGSTITLSNTLTGGVWSSSLPSFATIGPSSGILSGASTGVATITYMTTAGCFVVTNITVNPTPVINSFSSTNPTTCVTNDGTVTLKGLTSGQSYTVNYLSGTTPVSIVLVADGTGSVKITGLAAGAYTNFTVTTTLGCASNVVAGPIVLTLPSPPPAPIAGNNTPICDGISLSLTATDATPGVTYSWSGPGGYTSTLQNPVLNPSVMAEAGTYTVTATILGCVSAPSTTLVVIHPIPDITSINFTNPGTCQGADGTITLGGLSAGVSYVADYSFGGNPASATLVADASGDLTITGLAAGNYSGFNVRSFTCRSNTVGPVTLKDPNPPPAPRLSSNSPICSGKTLTLDATDDLSGVSYDWAGPNGFSSNQRNPDVPNVSMADSGLYTLTIRYLNCPTVASENIIVYPPVVLKDVTQSQAIPLGSSIALNASGAEFYLWAPNDGTLSNPNIDNPTATPQQTTVYIVEAMNKWGCVDSAEITISIDNDAVEGVPGAFTPNGDGKNDVFKVENVKYDKLVDFSVFNRWGQLIYHNTYDVKQGWDGRFNGVLQDMGTYDYRIILSDPNGKLKYFKGSVTLIR